MASARQPTSSGSDSDPEPFTGIGPPWAEGFGTRGAEKKAGELLSPSPPESR